VAVPGGPAYHGAMAFWRRSGPSRTLTLPPQGKVLILSDLHGHVGDWEAFLRSSQVLERLEAGEDLWLVITGDVPDTERHRTLDGSVPSDGDVTIIEALMAARERLGERGERIVYVEGNHDFHLSRIAREIPRYFAGQRGDPIPSSDTDEAPTFTVEERDAYFAYYRETYGDQIFNNNIAPYDMIARLRPEHVRFVESSPILVVCEGAGILVTHAGPPRMNGWKPRTLKKAIDRASREHMRTAPPHEYYESPYHQLLNNRFRNADYSLSDLEAFLRVYDGGVLVTGHTPHPYLVDFEKRTPLEGCAFRSGLGLIGSHQVVLCSSFGAFHPSLKRYLELDLSRRFSSVDDLFEDEETKVRPVYDPDETMEAGAKFLPGVEFIT